MAPPRYRPLIVASVFEALILVLLVTRLPEAHGHLTSAVLALGLPAVANAAAILLALVKLTRAPA